MELFSNRNSKEDRATIKAAAAIFSAWASKGGGESKAEIDDYAARLAQHNCRLTRSDNGKWIVTFPDGRWMQFDALEMLDFDPNTSAMVSW